MPIPRVFATGKPRWATTDVVNLEVKYDFSSAMETDELAGDHQLCRTL